MFMYFTLPDMKFFSAMEFTKQNRNVLVCFHVLTFLNVLSFILGRIIHLNSLQSGKAHVSRWKSIQRAIMYRVRGQWQEGGVFYGIDKVTNCYKMSSSMSHAKSLASHSVQCFQWTTKNTT